MFETIESFGEVVGTGAHDVTLPDPIRGAASTAGPPSYYIDGREVTKRRIKLREALQRTRSRADAEGFPTLAGREQIRAATGVYRMPGPIERPAESFSEAADRPLGRDYRAELIAALEAIAGLEAGWDGGRAPKPKKNSLKAMRRLIVGLPPSGATAQLGISNTGNVFIHATLEQNHVFITVEPRRLHLLGNAPGRENEFIDDEAYDGKAVPASILEALARNLNP